MTKSEPAARAARLYTPQILTRAELRQRGFTGRALTNAVSEGRLLRLRRDRYAAVDIDPAIAEAVRIGGRLSCLSLLQLLGIFVHECVNLHVHIAPGTTRLRAPASDSTVLHWKAWSGDAALRHAVSIRDAVLQAVHCQPPRAAIATLDSVIHHGLLTMNDLRDVFADLPRRCRPLLRLVDGSAGSGPETYLRLLLRTLGLNYETQVLIAGVGYVDFVVDGWLIIECDSREFHADWPQQVKDRHRDIFAAAQGYVTIRPVASDILGDGAAVGAWIRSIVDVLGPRFAGRRA